MVADLPISDAPLPFTSPTPIFTYCYKRRRRLEDPLRENPFSFSRHPGMDSRQEASADLSSSSVVQPRTFTLFALLPIELQLHIWTLSLSERRIIPVYIAPLAHKSACALMRFLLSTDGSAQIHTKPLRSLKIAPFACKASFEMYNRMYKNMLLIRGDRKVVHAKYSSQDVVFFKMGLSSKLYTHLSLTAFERWQPAATKNVRRIALETVGDLGMMVSALKAFEMLEEVVIVLPAVRTYIGLTCNFTDALDNTGNWEQRGWELGLRIERTGEADDLKRKIEEMVRCQMERLRKMKWNDWKLPRVRVVETWEQILET